MSSNVRVDMVGAAELEKILVELGEKIALKMAKRYTWEVTNVIYKYLRESGIVPKKTGALENSFVIKSRKKGFAETEYRVVQKPVKRQYANNSQNRSRGRVGRSFYKTEIFYGKFLEFGTQKIKTPNPFFRRAFDQSFEGAVKHGQSWLQEAIAKEVKKQNSRRSKK